MKKFTGLRLQNLAGNTGLAGLALMFLMGLTAVAVRAQTNFASPQVLDFSQGWGSLVCSNLGINPTNFIGNPSIAGNPPIQPLWFQWTVPPGGDGEVELDTIGSIATNGTQLDTLLAVYAGTNLSGLYQIAANDDIYPYSQFNFEGTSVYVTNTPNVWDPLGSTNPFTEFFLNEPFQPFSGGPSGLRFNAVAGMTYYIAVDARAGGQIALNWAYHSSGVFRFATEGVDWASTITGTNPMLLYQCAETEGQTPVGENGNIDAQTVTHTYYDYNNPGMLMTVTRVAGYSGRVSVDYLTVPGPTNQITGDVAAVPGDVSAVLPYTPGHADFKQVHGTLVFDDFEMSKTILIPIGYVGLPRPNRVFTVILTNAVLDPNETPAVSPPRVDPVFGKALVRILDVSVDPKGACLNTLVLTHSVSNTVVPYQTNYSWTTIPTNAVLNFQKAHYRVAREVTNFWGATPVTIYVNRTGTNSASTTAMWRINNYLTYEWEAGYDQQNIYFPLQPGSDYAMPDPPNANGIIFGVSPPDVPSYTNSSGNFGTLTWAANDFQPKAIQFTVYDNGLTEFNKDLSIQLYRLNATNQQVADQVGMVAEATVTIMFDDQHPPAGSVDEFYNADWNLDLRLAPANLPVTTIQNNIHPGTDAEVYGLAVLTNNETIIVGAFSSYNTVSRIGVALVNTNGMLDLGFNPGQGANNPVNAVALAPGGKYYIGGEFTSYNGQSANGIARLNANGSLDTSFVSGGNGHGADSTVRAIAVQPDGKVLIGGDFAQVDGVVRNNIARLNPDGSLDTTFDPGTNFDNSVYALALQPSGGGQILVGGGFDVGGQGYGNIALLNTNGTLNTSFNPGTGPDNWVFALCWQPDGELLLGGAFSHINGSLFNGIARLNPDGSIDSAFSPGLGADGFVQSISYATNVITSVTVTNNAGTLMTNTAVSSYNVIYVGGSFTSFNGTHRLGFARLYNDGTVDTTFLDTAYNQFAGLPRIYFSDSPGTVYASGVQNDGNVMIGGYFDEVGGGQADKFIRNTNCAERAIAQSFGDTNLWVSLDQQNIEPKTRDGVRNRSNVARLIGGSVNGPAALADLVNPYAPGNIGLLYNAYSVDESGSSRDVELNRYNGALGPAGANFQVQPGLAQSGVDFLYQANEPLYWIAWEYTDKATRMHGHGFYGTNGYVEDIYGRFFWGNDIADLSTVKVTVHPDPTVRGNLTAQFQLANPANADQFYLGGQNIPLGVALGLSTAPFTLVDDNQQAGQFGFIASSFIASNATAAVTVGRSNGMSGNCYVTYATSNGTAVAGSDYIPTNGTLTFSPPKVANSFNVKVYNNGYIYTNPVEKTVVLLLKGITGSSGATFGLSNAVLRLINPNYKGYLSFSATNYAANESAGSISFVVNRTSGSLGPLSVQYATTNGTALNGVDYIGVTNTLNWGSNDVSPRIVSIQLTTGLTVGPNKQFYVSLFNPANNGVPDPTLMGMITNASLTISNNNSFGTLQLSATNYFVDEYGGYATITVLRTGGAAGTAYVNFTTLNVFHGAQTGINYFSTNGVLTFAPGQIAASFNVVVTNDNKVDTNLMTFKVALSNAVNAVLGSPTNAIVNILDMQAFNWTPGTPGTGTNSISSANGSVLALALQSNGQILAGGNFTQINNVPEYYVARINPDGSLDTTFPNVQSGPSGANGPVHALAIQSDGRILMGGNFTTVNGTYFNYLARVMTDGSLDSSFNPGAGADGIVYSLAETFVGGAREIYVGGAFSHINNWNIASPGLARLNNDGTLDPSFSPGLGFDGNVYAIAAYPTNSIYAGKVLIGGSFTHYNGTTQNYLVRLNVDGSVDATFNPGSAANGIVYAIAIQPDGRVLVGGDFLQFNNVPLNRIARLNADGSLDAGFTTAIGAGINNTVDAIVLQPDNRILVTGQFTLVNNSTHNRIVRLLPGGAVDTSINFGDGANAEVNAAAVQPSYGMIILGGAFTQFNDQPYGHLIRLYGGSQGGSSGSSLVIPAGSTLVAESGPVNSIIDPGETVTLMFAFTNSFGNNVSDLVATLLPTNGIAPATPASKHYGPLVAGGPAVSEPFTFTNSPAGTNGQLITATFQLNDGSINLGFGTFTYMLGTLTNSFASTNLIVINQFGAATPYPSLLNVSGVGGTLIKATVTFSKLAHTYPSDIDALVQSPAQQSTLLMTHAGGGDSISGVTLTFDDNASAYLTNNGLIVSGTYKPTAYILVPPYNQYLPLPATPYATNLSSLNGSNPNGAWSLFVIDDSQGDAGAISNGWSLNLITASPVPPAPLTVANIVSSPGSFQLSIVGPATGSGIVEVSTNLLTWLPVETNTPPFTYTDTNTSAARYRFYRVVPAP